MPPVQRTGNPRAGGLMFYNDHAADISHEVPRDTFADSGDAATVCGIVVTGCDPNPDYGMCVECAIGWDD